MASSPINPDPHSDQGAAERDVRPVVKKPRAGLSGLAIGVGALAAALMLFLVLDARRQALVAPAVAPRTIVGAESAAPPLYIPPEPPPARQMPTQPAPTPPLEPTPARPPAPPPAVVYMPSPAPAPAEPALPPRNLAAPALVVDAGVSRPPAAGQASDAAPPTGNTNNAGAARVHTAMLANPTMTVPQGTLIPAVLETALNSSHPGFARALVQRDVRGFDGTRVLIPRGSRLIGQYAGNAAQGQERAFIAWSRLIRPDGVTIAIDSPAADPVGRGGIDADVDSHFFKRFTGAILQSVLDIGVNLASRSADSPVVVALPGSFQNATGTIAQPTQIPPTLKVKPGTSISIFVARDLDFSGADGGNRQ
jgi:type IV secretion system protein VirB10